MTKKQFNGLARLWINWNDKQRWEFIRDNQHLGYIVQLDNDSTFIIHPDIEDEYLDFDTYLGWTDGLQTFLNVFNIKAETV